MKKLIDILKNIHYQTSNDLQDVHINYICMNSNVVKNNDLFVAVKGNTSDGHHYIESAIEKGAKVIVCEQLPQKIKNEIVYIKIENTAKSLGDMAANYYQHPSTKMKVVGITGTNGKTTCATLLYELFTKLNKSCGLISTIQNKIGNITIESTHTTPDAIQLQHLMAQMYEAGCTHVFMEVSSHAIHQHRIQGIHFEVACFTNITHDHLDYHKTFDEYIKAKKAFFDMLPSTAFALTNIDDKRGMVMLQNTAAHKKTYSLKTMSDFKGKILENNRHGLFMLVNEKEISFQLLGVFNAYNLLCIYGTAILLGQNKEEVLLAMSSLKGAEGRFDYIISKQEKIMGIVDYAHTPDALLNVLATIEKLRANNENVYTVMGCGGNRDKEKRPLMALVACEHSNKVILTADNPRNEKINDIIADMENGIPAPHKKKYLVIPDRKEAIKTACSIAQSGDIILIAGKGHEKYQEIEGVKYPFDDKKILNEMFELLEK